MQTQAEIAALIQTLSAGDVVEIEFTRNGCSNVRSVRVAGHGKTDSLFLESGKAGVYGWIMVGAGGLYYQPTLQQKGFPVVGLKAHKVLTLRAA